MAHYFLPRPGTEAGPCKDTNCGHKDCGLSRKDAESICHYCHKPIGYEVAIYFLPDNQGIVHRLCYHEDMTKATKDLYC